jgi:hypothetical protein
MKRIMPQWRKGYAVARMRAIFPLRSLCGDIRGGPLAEYAIVLAVLSISIWLIIQSLVVNIVNNVDGVATSAAALGAQGMPSIPVPDSSL